MPSLPISNFNVFSICYVCFVTSKLEMKYFLKSKKKKKKRKKRKKEKRKKKKKTNILFPKYDETIAKINTLIFLIDIHLLKL